MTVALEESRQSAGATGDPIELAKVGHVRLLDSVEMIFNTVDTAIVKIIGLNSIMLVATVSAQSNLDFMGRHHDPHTLVFLPTNNPHPINNVTTPGAGAGTWSWGGLTSPGGGSKEDATMIVCGFLRLVGGETAALHT